LEAIFRTQPSGPQKRSKTNFEQKVSNCLLNDSFMVTHRLSAEERRLAIVKAAAPLFAQKGFTGTTTRELAEAAGISEALLFKHFPNKSALYEEILAQKSREGESAFRRIQTLEPSTASLIHMVHLVVFLFTRQQHRQPEEFQNRHRLILHSLLEDGEFARLVYSMVETVGKPKFLACWEAARVTGDLLATAAPADRSFWLMHHLATMLGYVRLPNQAMAEVRLRPDAAVEETVRFILHGMGLREAAIQLHYHPKSLNAFLAEES
jgi:TetR/AcrR family transcriptional regulator, transcriptional repressor of aconitase